MPQNSKIDCWMSFPLISPAHTPELYQQWLIVDFRDFENYQNFQVKESAKNGQATERLEELAKPKKNFVETQVRKIDEHYWFGS